MTIKSTNAIWLVTRREVLSRVVSKVFLVGLSVIAIVIFAIFGLVLGSDSEDAANVGIVGVVPAGALENLDAVASLQDTDVEVLRFATEVEAIQALENGDVDGFVVDQRVVMTQVDPGFVALVTPAWQQAVLVAELGDAGLTQAQIGGALTDADALEVIELDADPDADSKETVAFLSVVLLFVSIQVAGTYIMLGVFEEKSTKVVELVLSSIPARDLLIGKMLGVGVLGIVQISVCAGSAIAAAVIFSSAPLPGLSVGLVATGLVWFILGYTLYGSVFAAGASLAPRQEDAQSTLAPVSIILMLSYFGAIFSASDPDSTLTKAISWVPFTAPFTMPGRIAAGDASWLEVYGSMALTAAGSLIAFGLARRIYVRSVIHTDRKLGWREAWTLQT